MSRPTIAVVGGSVDVAVNLSSRQRACVVADALLALVADHGGVPLVIPDRIGPAAALQLARSCDGLLLPPGRDIDPAAYGAACLVDYSLPAGVGQRWRRSEMMRPERDRDEVEMLLFHAFHGRGAPVFGICRGLQLVNVALGGTLHQEIETGLSHFVEADGWIPHHAVCVDAASLAGGLLGRDDLVTSSVHHQSIATLGRGLRVSGEAEDATAEIIEAEDSSRFVMGFQGHVEKGRARNSRLERVFAEFIARATAVRARPQERYDAA